MINYFFVLNISKNEIVFDKPKNKKETYRIYVKQAIAKIKPQEMRIKGKGKKRFPNEERIMYQKIDSKLLLAAIVVNVRRDLDIYGFFADFNLEMQKYRGNLRDNTDLESWAKKQIKSVNELNIKSSIELNRSNNSSYNMKLSLIQIDEEPSDIENPTTKPLIINEVSEMNECSPNISSEFNGKTQVALWGVFGLIALCLGLIGIELFSSSPVL